jgi:hypothetical protein
MPAIFEVAIRPVIRMARSFAPGRGDFDVD